MATKKTDKTTDKHDTEDRVINGFKIEKLPMPDTLGKARGPGRTARWPYKELGYHESFAVELDSKEVNTLRSGLGKYQRVNEGYKFATETLSSRTVEGKTLTTYRIWCVEHPDHKKAA